VYEVSERFLAALTAPHRIVAYCDLVDPTGRLQRVPVTEGSVSIDRTADSRWSASVTIVANRLENSLSLRLRRVSPYGSTFTLWRGIRFADGTEELVPLGRYYVEEVSWSPDLIALSVSGVDQAALVDRAPITVPSTVASDSTIKVLSSLLRDIWLPHSVTLPAPDTGLMVVHPSVVDAPVVDYEVADERWANVSDLAQAIGAEVYPDDSTSRWRVDPIPNPATAVSVHTVQPGRGGTLISYDRAQSREGLYNFVIVRGDTLDGGDVPVYAIAQDLDPFSPTSVPVIGRVVEEYESSALLSNAACQVVADAMLNERRGLSATLSLSVVPNPALRPGDAITVDFADGRVTEKHLIDSLTIPLGAGDFQINTRATTV
jgi:hypothetical protein